MGTNVGVAAAFAFLAVWAAAAAPGLHDLITVRRPLSRAPAWDAGLLAALRRLTPFAGLLAAPALPLAAIAFVFAPSDAKLIPGLLMLGAGACLASLRLRSEAQQYLAAKLRFPPAEDGLPLGDGLQLTCPRCGKPLRTARVTRALIACPLCRPPSTFRVRPAVGPVALTLAAVSGIWLLAVSPWQAGASPLAVAAWSAICAGLCLALPPVLDLRRQLREAPGLALDVFDDVWIAFAVMALTALGFAGANAALPRLAPSPVAEMTVRQLLAFQRRVHELGEGLERAHVTLWGAALALLALAILARLGCLVFADRLNRVYKGAAKALKIVSLAILCVSAFSLTGASGTAGLHQALSRTFQLDALSAPGLERAVDQMSREIASRAAQAILKSRQLAVPRCTGDHAAPCPGPVIAALRGEAAVAKAQADLWPHTADGRPVGQDPSSGLGAEAAAVAGDLTTLRDAKPQPAPAIAAYQDLPAAGAARFTQAMASEVQPSPAESPLDARRREMADLAVGLLFSLLPLDPGGAAKPSLGAFPAELVGAVGDALKAPFKDAAQEAAAKAMAACASGADCQAAVRRELAKAQHDPRVAALAQALVRGLSGPAALWTQLEDRLRAANARADGELERMAEPGQRDEQAGEWGRLRARLNLAGAFDGANEPSGVRLLRFEWPRVVYQAALADVGRPGLAADRWDRRFSAFLFAHPRAAAAFCYFLIHDPDGRAVLAKHLPDDAPAPTFTVPRIRGIGERDPPPAPPAAPTSRVDAIDYNDALSAYVTATGTTDIYNGLNVLQKLQFWDDFSAAGLPPTAKGARKKADAAAEAQRQADEQRRTDDILKREGGGEFRGR